MIYDLLIRCLYLPPPGSLFLPSTLGFLLFVFHFVLTEYKTKNIIWFVTFTVFHKMWLLQQNVFFSRAFDVLFLHFMLICIKDRAENAIIISQKTVHYYLSTHLDFGWIQKAFNHFNSTFLLHIPGIIISINKMPESKLFDEQHFQ